MLRQFLTAALLVVSSTHAKPRKYVAPNDTVQCGNDMIKWCEGMKYPTDGAGLSVVSITISEPNGFYRYLCTSDCDGTNCTRNAVPWFLCSNDNQFFYKGTRLSRDSTNGTDSELCQLADRAFNDLLMRNLSYDVALLKTELQKGLKSVFKEVEDMKDEIDKLIRGGKFWFPFWKH